MEERESHIYFGVRVKFNLITPGAIPVVRFEWPASAAFTIVAAAMKSMTGYGWGECAQDGFKVTVELSSVNRKQSEITVNLPRELEVLEAQVRDDVNKRIARGRLTARVTLHAGD